VERKMTIIMKKKRGGGSGGGGAATTTTTFGFGDLPDVGVPAQPALQQPPVVPTAAQPQWEPPINLPLAYIICRLFFTIDSTPKNKKRDPPKVYADKKTFEAATLEFNTFQKEIKAHIDALSVVLNPLSPFYAQLRKSPHLSVKGPCLSLSGGTATYKTASDEEWGTMLIYHRMCHLLEYLVEMVKAEVSKGEDVPGGLSATEMVEYMRERVKVGRERFEREVRVSQGWAARS